MNNLSLKYEEIKKFEGLKSLNYGIYDALLATIFHIIFIALIGVFHPPIFNVINTNFIFQIVFFCFYIIPILLISIFDIINNYKVIKNKNKETKVKDYRLISALSFYTIPLLFLIYLPTNIIEFFIWIITAFILYIGFGKFPLIKYSIELFYFPSNNLYFNKKVVRNISPSIFSLGITLWIIWLVISLRIYPIPFLLIFCIKYLIQRRYFRDLSSKNFYENWYRSEKYLRKWVEHGLIINGLIAVILLTLAYLDYSFIDLYNDIMKNFMI